MDMGVMPFPLPLHHLYQSRQLYTGSRERETLPLTNCSTQESGSVPLLGSIAELTLVVEVQASQP